MSDTITKPNFSEEECKSIVLSVWGLTVDRISCLPSYDDQNFCVWCQGSRYVVKFFHAEVSSSVMSLQEGVMFRLREGNISAPFPLVTLGGRMWHKGRDNHYVRMLEWVDGNDWADLSIEERVACAEQLGELCGKVDKSMLGWRSEGGGEDRQWIWRTSDAWMVEDNVKKVVARRQGQERQKNALKVLQQLKDGLDPNNGWLLNQPMGIIHGDVNGKSIRLLFFFLFFFNFSFFFFQTTTRLFVVMKMVMHELVVLLILVMCALRDIALVLVILFFMPC